MGLHSVAVARFTDLLHVLLEELRQAHDVRLVAQRAQHEGANVPRGVGGEAHAASCIKESDGTQQPLRPLLQEVGLLEDGGLHPVGPHLVHLVVHEPLVVVEELVIRRTTQSDRQPELGITHILGHLDGHLGLAGGLARPSDGPARRLEALPAPGLRFGAHLAHDLVGVEDGLLVVVVAKLVGMRRMYAARARGARCGVVGGRVRMRRGATPRIPRALI